MSLDLLSPTALYYANGSVSDKTRFLAGDVECKITVRYILGVILKLQLVPLPILSEILEENTCQFTHSSYFYGCL